jgi:cytoskeleton protein RodZ
MRGVSLDDIADATKIGTRLLRALEEEHFELLPGGIFNKGFVRAYAKYLGLNEEEAVADYLEAAGEITPDPRVIAEQNSSRIDRSGGEASSRQAGFPIVPVLILLLVIAAGAGGWQIYQKRVHDLDARRQTTAVTPPVGGSAASANNPGVAATPASPADAGSAKTETPHSAASSAGASPQGTTTTTAPIDLNASVAKDREAPANQRVVASPDTAKPNTSGVANPGTTLAVASAETFEVTVRAKDSAWVSIKSDGRFAVRGIIRSPDVKTVHASEQVVVWTGNAGAVEVSFNGQPVPLAGGPNQEGVLVFNSSGVVTPKPAQ